MALLGQLTVGILGDMSGYSKALSGAQKETLKFSKGMERMGRDISTIGYGFQDLGSKLTNKITKPAIIAGTAVSGLVGTLGFKRLVGMDNAQAKLKGLGYGGKEVDSIMQDVEGAVKGTTHTMAEGVNAAAGALAAGVEQGSELERYIKLVGDAAIGSNRPMDEMAQIFNRVQGSGKLMTMELDMIEHGMPGFAQAMADNLAGGSLKTFKEMVTNGQVGSAEFLDVMEDFAGGMSDAYSETWEGMAKNVLSNIGIIGEGLLEGIFEDGKKGLAKFLEILRESEGLKTWAKETGESIRNMVQVIVEKVADFKSKWDGLSAPIQNIIKKLAIFGSIGAVAIGPVLLYFGKFIVTIGSVVTKFGRLAGAGVRLGGVMGILTGPIGIVIGVLAALVGIGVLVYKNWDTLKEKAQIVFSSFEPLLETVKGAFSSLFDSVAPITENLKGIWEGLTPIFTFLAQLIGVVVVPAFGLLLGVFSGLIAAIGPFINAILSFFNSVISIVNVVISLFKGDFTGAMEYWSMASESAIEFVKSLWESVVEFFSTIVETIIDFFHGLYMTLVGNSIIPDMVEEIVEWFTNMGEWLIDIVTFLVDGVVLIFTSLYNGVALIFETLLGVLVDIWQYISNTFENAVSFIYALVTGDFEGMKTAMSNQMENARNLLSNIWDRIKGLIGTKASQILTDIIKKFLDIKNNMVNKINEARVQVVNKFTEIVSGVRNKASEVVSTVKDKFNDVKSRIIEPITEAKNKVSEIVGDIKGFFTNLKLKIPTPTLPKLPKFSLKTSSRSILGKEITYPSGFDVKWNALGGVFKKPTIFNTANAGLQGVGEAGAEAIIPLKPSVLAGIGKGISNEMGDNNVLRALLNQNNLTEELIKRIDELEFHMSMDSKVVGKAVANTVDDEIGSKTKLSERGVTT